MKEEHKIKLRTLEADIRKWGNVLREAAQTVINEEVSNYPIFVAHQYSLNVGLPLIAREQSASNWSFNATTLEELATKNIIEQPKIDPFRQLYKSKPVETFVCVFVVEEDQGEFVFYPYDETHAGQAASDVTPPNAGWVEDIEEEAEEENDDWLDNFRDDA